MSAPPLLRPASAFGTVAAVWAVVILAALLPPFAQPQSYHAFADARPWLGIPNFLDVASNLAFLAAGGAGIAFLAQGAAATPAGRACYAIFFGGAIATAVGSGYYHWSPDDARLAWDRAGMAIAFMGVLAATIADRGDERTALAAAALLVPLGAASVAWWPWSAARGAESILPYLAAQVGALAGVVVLTTRPSRFDRRRDIAGAIALYAAAIAAETLDRPIYASVGVSGHTVKHLLAGLAIFQLARMLRLRSAR